MAPLEVHEDVLRWRRGGDVVASAREQRDAAHDVRVIGGGRPGHDVAEGVSDHVGRAVDERGRHTGHVGGQDAQRHVFRHGAARADTPRVEGHRPVTGRPEVVGEALEVGGAALRGRHEHDVWLVTADDDLDAPAVIDVDEHCPPRHRSAARTPGRTSSTSRR